MGFIWLIFIGLTALAAADSETQNSSITFKPFLMDTRIVGGYTVDIAQHPHQISMRYRNVLNLQGSYSHRCGGSIIRNDLILTAAHCIIGTVPSEFKIISGTNYRRGSDGVVSLVEQIIMHEDYDPWTFSNDVALLKLSVPIALDNITMRAIELAEDIPKHGANSVVSGWGTTSESGISADTLQEVHVPIVSNDICDQDYSGGIDKSMLCAGFRGVGGKDACQGDSGGPLLVNGKLAGIVSWGYGCARPEYPGVYANVANFVTWITENMLKLDDKKL